MPSERSPSNAVILSPLQAGDLNFQSCNQADDEYCSLRAIYFIRYFNKYSRKNSIVV
jgi:hypothetical protein